jgi:hypothetical protein
MKLSAKFIKFLPSQSGESSNGNWTKQDFVVETKETYPKKVVITNWNNQFDVSNINDDTYYNFEILVESNPYNGNYYSSVILNGEPQIMPPGIAALASGFKSFTLPSLIIELLPEIKGSNWTKREIIFEPNENSRKRYSVQVINDKVDLTGYSQGDEVNIEFYIESREYNNRWHTDFKARKIDLLKKGTSQSKKYDINDPDSWPF